MQLVVVVAAVLAGAMLAAIYLWVLVFLVVAAARSAWYGDLKPVPPGYMFSRLEAFHEREEESV